MAIPAALAAIGLDAGKNAANNIVGQAMGLALEGHEDKRQLKQQGKLQKLQIQGSKELTDYNMMKQLEMWKNTSYPAQIELMKEAGLNPGLMYGMGGGGGQTTGSANGNVSGAAAPSGTGTAGEMGMQLMQMRLMRAQEENINADTEKKKAEVPNVQADTENKILQKVINDYLGKDAARQFDIKNPNKGVEQKTYQDELEARQGVAGTIYELWAEGKLKEKSVAEIQNILLDNAEKEQNVEKRRQEIREIYKKMDLLDENIKGAKLDNIIRDIETKMQQETGVDRNAPTWLKIIARLFGHLMPSTK